MSGTVYGYRSQVYKTVCSYLLRPTLRTMLAGLIKSGYFSVLKYSPCLQRNLIFLKGDCDKSIFFVNCKIISDFLTANVGPTSLQILSFIFHRRRWQTHCLGRYSGPHRLPVPGDPLSISSLLDDNMASDTEYQYDENSSETSRSVQIQELKAIDHFH